MKKVSKIFMSLVFVLILAFSFAFVGCESLNNKDNLKYGYYVIERHTIDGVEDSTAVGDKYYISEHGIAVVENGMVFKYTEQDGKITFVWTSTNSGLEKVYEGVYEKDKITINATSGPNNQKEVITLAYSSTENAKSVRFKDGTYRVTTHLVDGEAKTELVGETMTFSNGNVQDWQGFGGTFIREGHNIHITITPTNGETQEFDGVVIDNYFAIKTNVNNHEYIIAGTFIGE